MKTRWFFGLILGLFVLSSGAFGSEKVVIYGHISFIEEGVSVVRGDGAQEKNVVVNLPIAAGDTITTGDRARCEIQGDNGTIIRLDQNTVIKFETVLAQSLTSKWKITSLRLESGNLYTMNKVYNREMVQVQTPNAAIKIKNNSKCLIYLDRGTETQLRVLSGKMYVMFGSDSRSLQVEKLTAGEEARITAKNELVFEPVGDADFFLWNEGMNKNFEEMHDGISKLPKPLYRYPRAVVDWAENWSSLYGNWVYDDFLGYVWHPYHEHYANVQYCPFYNAKYVTIGGNFYMVPQEAWGWVPMYLGIWHWSPKYGWIWIPGSAFDYGYDYYDVRFPFYGYRTLWDFYYHDMYFWRYGFSAYSYYYYFGDIWNYPFYWDYQSIIDAYNPEGNPALVLTPENLKDDHSLPPDGSKIIRRLGKLSEDKRKEILGNPEEIKKFATASRTESRTLLEKISPARESKNAVGTRKILEKGTLSASRVQRNWNPDWKWAQKNNLEVKLNRAANEYACPRLNITASQVSTTNQKKMLRMYGDSVNHSSGTTHGGNVGRGDSSSGSVSSQSSSSGSSSASTHSSSSSSGSVGTHKKD